MGDIIVLEYALNCYGFEGAGITDINSGSNKVYKIRKGGRNFYLRISKRGYDYVAAEIDWILFLKGEISAPELLKSKNGRLLETYTDSGQAYVICAFYELPGVYWDKNDPALWNENVFYSWGATMGKMHRLTKEYRPPGKASARPRCEDSLLPAEFFKNYPTVRAKLERIRDETLALPKDADSYGLIHSDMHQQNILIDGSGISVLDFDDCRYGFFSLDIGIALYHAVWWGLPDACGSKNGFALSIINNFMAGYGAQNKLSRFWRKKIFMFMLYRQIDALSWHLNYFKPKSIDETVYNDCFKIYFDFRKHIEYIEKDIFFDGCTINENVFSGGGRPGAVVPTRH